MTLIDDAVAPLDQPDDYLTIDEAARTAKVSKRTVYNWITAGKVAVVVRPSGSKLVVRASLLRSPAAVADGETTIAVAIQAPTIPDAFAALRGRTFAGTASEVSAQLGTAIGEQEKS